MPWTSTLGQKPIATMGTLDPGQSALAKQLQKMLSGVKSPEDYLSGLTSFLEGKGPSPFGGPLGSESIAALKRAMSGRAPDPFAGPLGGETMQALRDAMSGEVSEEYFQKSVVGPAMKTFRRDIAPRLREEHVGPGTFWGGARGESVGRGYSDLAGSIAAARGGMAQEALGRASQTALGYTGLTTQAATSAQERAKQAALGYGELMSKGTSDWIQAYLKANPAYSDTINSILGYLNTPTMLAYQDPEYIPSAIKEAMKKPKSYKEWIGGEYVDVGSHPIMQI